MMHKKGSSKVHVDKQVQVDFGCGNCDGFIENVGNWEVEVCTKAIIIY